jgi:hypothetical protein
MTPDELFQKRVQRAFDNLMDDLADPENVAARVQLSPVLATAVMALLEKHGWKPTAKDIVMSSSKIKQTDIQIILDEGTKA